MKAGIIGAIKHEVELLFSELEKNGNVKKKQIGKLEFHSGRIGKTDTVVVTCGVGKVNAALCAQILITSFAVDFVINTGAAGGIAPNMNILDMVVSLDAVQHDVDASHFGYEFGQIPGMANIEFSASADLIKKARQAFNEVKKSEQRDPEIARMKLYEGRVASGDVFVASDKIRNTIIARFNPLCVEMEGAAIAQVCFVNRVPFVILRSISDLAGKEAGMNYDEFAHKASTISARILVTMLNEMEDANA